jgi:hypothetical protein
MPEMPSKNAHMDGEPAPVEMRPMPKMPQIADADGEVPEGRLEVRGIQSRMIGNLMRPLPVGEAISSILDSSIFPNASKPQFHLMDSPHLLLSLNTLHLLFIEHPTSHYLYSMRSLCRSDNAHRWAIPSSDPVLTPYKAFYL